MTIAERILGSRTLAALASPHGVDRYLEMVNPMWAATEVRARVVDIHRENPDSDAASVATAGPERGLPGGAGRGERQRGQLAHDGDDVAVRGGAGADGGSEDGHGGLGSSGGLGAERCARPGMRWRARAGSARSS